MKHKTLAVLGMLFLIGGSVIAKADNELTQAELLDITKQSMDDYTTNNPEHAKHISGFKTITVKTDGKVTLTINHDGMTMTAAYYCVRQTSGFQCTEQ